MMRQPVSFVDMLFPNHVCFLWEAICGKLLAIFEDVVLKINGVLIICEIY